MGVFALIPRFSHALDLRVSGNEFGETGKILRFLAIPATKRNSNPRKCCASTSLPDRQRVIRNLQTLSKTRSCCLGEAMHIEEPENGTRKSITLTHERRDPLLVSYRKKSWKR